MDLISRTTVAEEIEELIEIKRMDMGVYNAGFYDALGRVKLMIADQPTIDAVPVVKGEWIYNQYYTWECGNCGFHPFKGFIPKEPGFNFCPNCGADMRKGGTE